MTYDDADTSHSHGFELPQARDVVVRRELRPWRVVAGVALCLGLAGVVAGLIIARRQSLSDEHLTADALQREELRDGWRALGAAAVLDAQARDAQARAAQPAPVANPATAAPAPPSVVIVNVPAPGAAAVPPSVTNINLPNGSTITPEGVGTDNANLGSGYAPNQGYTPNQGYMPDQSTPPLNYTPAQGYWPTMAYPFAPGSSAPRAGSVEPGVGNGSIPGSTPNPSLPNNGLVGSTPTPVVPSVNNSTTPSTPVGPAPASPGTPSLPSGFSAP